MVTTLYAGILGLLYVALSFYVIKGRFKHEIALGDDGNKDMMKRVRIHANFAEYVPFTLLLIILAEFEGTSEYLIHGLCVALLIGRLGHVYGVMTKDGTSVGRAGGTVATFLVIIVAAITCIQSFFIF